MNHRFAIPVPAALLLLSAMGGGHQGASSLESDWRALTSVERVCRAYPERMQALFRALDLERPDLAAVRRAYGEGSLAAAGHALLDHYRGGTSGSWLRREAVAVGADRDQAADAICEDRFTFYGRTAVVPRRADGRLDWDCRGPDDDVEWAWGLNRHHHLGTLLEALRGTGRLEYAARIDEHLRDWVTSSIPYPPQASRTSMWRGLEVALRIKQWARVFYGLQGHEGLSDGARLLLLSSLPDHAHYLRHFHGGGNWATMELSSLATIAVAWPELAGAQAWMEYARSTLTAELRRQVYPDGAQTELTATYHRVALENFELLAEACRWGEVPLPAEYRAGLEGMWSYLARTLRPDGSGPLNNDSDRDLNRSRILRAADRFGREDWRFLASNGAEGVAPTSGPSFFFPWAGQLVMRSGFDADAHWAFFDVGPWGTGHEHNDELHLSVAACGRDLLVDCGRFAYAGEVARRFRWSYATRSAAHNVLLVDGQGQGPGPARAERPLPGSRYRITEAFDHARGATDRFEGLEGRAAHARSVLYVRGAFWIVVDRVDTDRPRRIEALWHWHPDCTVAADGTRCRSIDADRGNLAIVPVGSLPWRLELVEGRDEPGIQGWYSRRYNEVEPCPTAVYTASLDASATFAWVLYPAKGPVPAIEATIVACDESGVLVRVTDAAGRRFDAEVPLTEVREASLTTAKPRARDRP